MSDKQLKAHRINDYSCVTKFRPPGNLHPLYTSKGLWMTPDSYSTVTVEKYGNIRFYTNNLDFTRDLNHYIIEFIDNGVNNTCRVLITDKEYPQLRRFDPINSNSQGPIYYEAKTGQFFKYSLCKRPGWPSFEHFEVHVFLAIQDETTVLSLVSYVQCKEPKEILKNEQIVKGHIEGHCDAVGEIKYAMFR